MNLKLIDKETFFSQLFPEKRPWQTDYLVMYSSQWRGYVTDPDLMMIPIDDHLAHRGDGVFDVTRCLKGNMYQLEAHLERLEDSAHAVSLKPPPDYSRVRELIETLVIKGNEEDCLIRVLLSRGPGSFSANPFDCPESQMYINVLRYHRPPADYYSKGIPVVTSLVPVKKSFFAKIKSCNYLPNVLMKREAVMKGCQYAIALDEEGYLTEGSTENMAVLSPEGVLKFPGFEKTLAGITAKRVFELAETTIATGLLKEVKFDRISQQEAYNSSEIILMGTSINIIPVVNYDGKPIGTGRPGPVYERLSDLFQKDMLENKALHTKIPWNFERGTPDP